ncbi:MAG: hypothetical protein AAF664_13565 [Planctomycetota bacterium]
MIPSKIPAAVLLTFLVGCHAVLGQVASPQTIVLDGESRSLPDIDLASPETIQAAIDRGVNFLLEDQNSNGSWGSPTKTKGLNIYAPVPGAHHAFRAATTSLCIAALLEVAPDDDRTRASIQKAEEWLLEHLKSLRRATGEAIYNVWGHAYSIQALTRLHGWHADEPDVQAHPQENQEGVEA